MIVNDEKLNNPPDGEERAKRKTPVFIFLMAFIILYSILFLYHAHYFCPSPLCYIFFRLPCRTVCGGSNTQCQSNLKNIGTALEMYATDNDGQFPVSLSKLIPGYLNEIPKCGAAGKDTYSISYTVAWSPDAYTVFCSGSYHTPIGMGANYPQYNSRQGLITK